MDAERCLRCQQIIPEGRQVCPICERKEVQIGKILQTHNATEDEVQSAYEWLYANLEDTIDMS